MKLLRALLLFASVSLVGCAAIYPEIGTRTRAVPAGQPLDPASPADLRWVRFVSGHVPELTRDGRPWQTNGKGADPYARFLVNGRELIKTPVEANTLSPTWPNGPKGNFRIGPNDRMRVELWDSNAIHDKPIAMRDIGRPTEEQILEKQIRIDFDDGAGLVLAFEPAHAVSGLGLWFSLRTGGCSVTRTLEASPAHREGLLVGDEILKIGIREVKAMTAEEVKSVLYAVPLAGIVLAVKHPNGTVADVALKEGPIYPTFAEYGEIE